MTDKPDIPQGPIVLDALLKNSVIISWKPPKDDGGCMITNYIVEKREDKEGMEWELVSSSINSTSCRVPNLIDSAGYFFRVYAQNRYGNSEPLELSSPILIKSQLGKKISEFISHLNKFMFYKLSFISKALTSFSLIYLCPQRDHHHLCHQLFLASLRIHVWYPGNPR